MLRLLPRLFLIFVPLLTFAAEPELVWEASGFTGPESIVYDQHREIYYVSNMGSYGEGAKPGDGFISRMNTAGKVLDTKWVTGFDNPKGLALANGRLYVGDDRGIAEIDLEAASIATWHVPADGLPAQFNDCTADPEGNVYAFSSRLNTIFRVHAGQMDPWLKLDTAVTGGLNGLRAEPERLLLGGWSVRDANGNEQLGHLSTVSFADKTVGRLGTTPICHVDGIEPDGRGGYTVTDWLTGDVKHVTADGVPSLIMTLVQGAADHEYIIDQQRLLIPLMKDNVVRAYHWVP